MSGRRPRLILAIGALAWVAVVAFAIVPLLDEDVDGGSLDATPLPATECPGLQLGVNSTLAFEGNAERRAATVAAIRDHLGASIVRDSLLWHKVEPVEGERDWSSPDGVVEDLREAGIEPLMVVLGSPPWANAQPESTAGHYLHVPPTGPALDAWLERYVDFLTEAVERYEGVVRRWEIWNEPNLAVFWRPRPDVAAYRQVYTTLRATILRADPAAEVAVGGLGALVVASRPDVSGLTFLRNLTRTTAPIDNVAIHAYTTDDHAPGIHIPGEKNFDDIGRVGDKLAAERGRPSVWLTEWGWSSTAVGEERQARYVDRSLAIVERRYPYVELATYFAEVDRRPDLFQGLLGQDLAPKPAARAFRRHADLAASRCERAAG